MNHERELVYKVIAYSIPKGEITREAMFSELKLTADETYYLDRFAFVDTPQSITPNTLFIRCLNSEAGQKYRLVPTALFSYNDYLELKAARKAANEARLLAILAIISSIVVPNWNKIESYFVSIIQ